jgi:hypothetical protein
MSIQHPTILNHGLLHCSHVFRSRFDLAHDAWRNLGSSLPINPSVLPE